MNELTSYCSQSLLKRLANEDAQPGGDVITLAEARIRREVARLPRLKARIIRWRFGLGCPQLPESEIAERLRMRPETVREIGDEALLELGFALISVKAAA